MNTRTEDRPASEASSTDALKILTSIWHVKAETARAGCQRIRLVLEWAIAMDLRNDNPCDRVLRCGVRRSASRRLRFGRAGVIGPIAPKPFLT